MNLKAGLLVTHPADHRVMFVLPWMNRTLVGTTDTFSDDSPDDVAAAPQDTEYLLAAVNHYFGQSLAGSDVVATMAGLRPLLSGKARDPSAVSREFAVIRSRSGLWSIAGGKYTTYRSMAQNLVDRIVAEGDLANHAPSRTARHRLIGAPSEEWGRFCTPECEHIAANYQLKPALVRHLIDRYGVRARQIAADHSGNPELWQSVVPGEPEVWAEFRHQSQHEMAIYPADHLLRRTRLGLFHRDPGLKMAGVRTVG
jgi:glycerol-3-phosphate dehydrogenase